MEQNSRFQIIRQRKSGSMKGPKSIFITFFQLFCFIVFSFLLYKIHFPSDHVDQCLICFLLICSIQYKCISSGRLLFPSSHTHIFIDEEGVKRTMEQKSGQRKKHKMMFKKCAQIKKKKYGGDKAVSTAATVGSVMALAFGQC